jgi:photosystem II stability/assembly factor-like uncharacterized protein
MACFMACVTFSADQHFRGPEGELSAGPASFFKTGFSFLCAQLRAAAALLFLCPLLLFPCEGQVWQHLGPAGGNVISLTAAADGSIYLGTADGHVFASSDRGEHWELRGRVGSRLDGVVQRIVAENGDPHRLLAGVRFQDSTQGGAVFESLDGARHWSSVGLAGEAVRALEHSESDPRVWIAGTRTGVFRSSDDARSWWRITPVDDPELQNVDSVAVDPGNPEIIYVGTYHLPWKTLDGGKTWASIASGMIDDSDVMSLRIDARDSRRIFSSACSGIYRSEDAGASWTKLQGIPYSSRRTQQIVQDPKDPRVLYAATTEGVWQTADYGESWRRSTPRETVANAMLVLPGTESTRVLAGMEAQGVLRSDDRGASFLPSNDGFSHRVIASLAARPGGPSHLLARADGFAGGLLETLDGGISWRALPAPAALKSPSGTYGTSSGFWLSFAQGGLAQFDSAKGQWRELPFREEIRSANSTGRPTVARTAKRRTPRTRIVLPHVRFVLELPQKILVATDDGLWKCNNGESEFRRVPRGSLPRSVTSLSAGAGDSLLALAGNSAWMSDSSALSWNAVAGPRNAGRLLWIREDPGNGEPRTLGAENGVFAAAPDGSWRLLANGLPAIASTPLAVSGSVWLLAMSNAGVYQSADFGKSWQRIDSDAEQGTVSHLFAIPGGGFYVASQSEGLLRWSTAPAGIP